MSRKALEQRKKAEEEEEHWKEKQRQREKKLQNVVVKRAQANDPHMSLSETQPTKLKEFRKMEIQRKKEYRQEIKEMRQRVKGRPLLLEQVAQINAKQTAEKRYTDALQGCDLTEEFINKKAAKSARKPPSSSDSTQSDRDDPDMGYKPVHFRKVYLNDDGDEDDPNETETAGKDKRDEGERDNSDSQRSEEDHQDSDENDHYSDDHDNYSDESEHEGTKEVTE